MSRKLVEKEVSAAKHVLHSVREWLQPRKVMKRHAFDRPLDDLGQTIDDVERRVEPPAPPVPPKDVPRA